MRTPQVCSFPLGVLAGNSWRNSACSGGLREPFASRGLTPGQQEASSAAILRGGDSHGTNTFTQAPAQQYGACEICLRATYAAVLLTRQHCGVYYASVGSEGRVSGGHEYPVAALDCHVADLLGGDAQWA